MSNLGALFLLIGCGAPPEAVAATAAPTAVELRQTIERATPFIAKQGDWWIEEKDCVTCHRIGNMVWSLAAARQRGIATSDQLDERYDWAIDFVLGENAAGKLVAKGNKEGLAQLMLAGPLLGNSAKQNTAFAKFEQVFLEDQQADGGWKPGGQLPSQKRPSAETTAVSTMWIALAMADRWPGNDHAAQFEKALAFIDASQPGKSTEWYAARLLLAAKMKDATVVDELAQKLRDQQQTDGGWGWLIGEPSDALGTGLSLFALARSAAGREAGAIARGQRFLIDTQRDDGAWDVRGTKAKKKDQITETAVYWGATWAVLGLSESLFE